MQNLIIYYSNTNYNKNLATIIGKKLSSQVEGITDKYSDKKGFKLYFSGGLSAILGKKTRINELKNNLEEYEQVILLSPIWAGTLPPAVKSFLSRNRDKISKLIYISISGEGKGNTQKALQEISKHFGKEPDKYLLFSKKEIDKESYRKELDEFIKNL